MQEPFLLVFCGIPCSGKSTLARKVAEGLANEHEIETITVTSDMFRRMISTVGHKFEPEHEQFVREATYRTIEAALRQKLVVISDDLNYYRSIRRKLRRVANLAKAGYEIIHVGTPLPVALEWNKKRGEPIPNALIEEIYYKLDKPGEKYKWDTPLVTLDPSEDKIDTVIELVASKIKESRGARRRPTPKKEPTERLSYRADLDRETRRAMSEIMKRYRNVQLAAKLSDLRKNVVKEAFGKRLSPLTATSIFLDSANSILKQISDKEFEGKTTLHVGLFGHVDHGKTQLARCLTEKTSTAALDKHPQAQERSMSIDMGFSYFSLGRYGVTLVDLPGHHSLIEHAVAGASIIDLAILVVAANEGPLAQTIEHLRILTSLGIKQLVVTINKADLATDSQKENVKSSVSNLLANTPFKNSPVACISAIGCEGIQNLKDKLAEKVALPIRDWSGTLKIPVSHAFHISGMGTVATGTILRGNIRAGEKVEIAPRKKQCKVRGIQIFGKNVDEASAGDRVGLTLSGVRPKEISRGDIIISPGTLEEKDVLDVELTVDPSYAKQVKPRDLAHVSVGLKTSVGRVFPYMNQGNIRILKRKVSPRETIKALIKMSKPLPVEIGDKALLMKRDLSHKKSRVIGAARVAGTPATAEIYSAKIKIGYIKEKTNEGLYVVSGLFTSKAAARHVAEKGRSVLAASSRSKGKIVKPHGNEADVLVSFGKPPDLREKIYYYRLRQTRID